MADTTSSPEHEPRDRYDVFVMYAEADRQWAEGYLLHHLREAGLRCLSKANFNAGVGWLDEYERAISQSARILPILSTAYVTTDEMQRFVNAMAQTDGIETGFAKVVPVLREAVNRDSIPARLRVLVPLDMTDAERAADSLAQFFQATRVAQPAMPPRKPDCPYPGMVAFSEADRGRFYGRDHEIRALIDSLHSYPFVTVIGASGSGKSSLVAAGLIPAIASSGLFGAVTWRISRIRPGKNPLATLADALNTDVAGLENDLPDLISSVPEKRLLVVDQFEELFTFSNAEAAAFQQVLLRLMQTPDCYVILVVRADFYQDLMACPLWPMIQAHRFEVQPLDQTALRQAILNPADAVGVYVEAALIERLIADATDAPGVLPLIQETLVLLWDRLEARFLSLAAYATLVLTRAAYNGSAASGNLNGLQVAIARRADDAINRLTPDQQVIARRVFLRLVQFGEGRDDTRRQQSFEALLGDGPDRAQVAIVLNRLADRRLLTLDGQEDKRTVDIAHEALIRSWPQLRGWVVERRTAEQSRRRLEAKADEWKALGRGTGGLLDEAELPEAERWIAGTDALDLGVSADLHALITSSRAQLTALALEKQRAQRRRVLLRVTAGILGLAVIAAVGLALGAIDQQHIALSRQQAAQALSIAVEQPFQALQMALDAEQSHQTVEADNSLLTTLQLNGQAAAIVPSTEPVTAVAFSADQHWLAIAAGATVQVFPLDHGLPVNNGSQPPLTLAEPDGATIQTLAADPLPDGNWLAVGTIDGRVDLWSIDAAASTQPVPIHLRVPDPNAPATNLIHAVAFSHDGKQLVAGGQANMLIRWDVRNPASPQPMPSPLPSGNSASPTAIWSVAFSADDQWLAVGRDDKSLVVWHTAPPYRPLVLTNGKHLNTVGSLSFSADQHWLASGDFSGTVILWDISALGASTPAGTFTKAISVSGVARAVQFSPDSQLLAVAGDGAADAGSLALYNLHNWRSFNGPPPQFGFPLTGHGQPVLSLAFNRSDELASGGSDQRVILWTPIDRTNTHLVETGNGSSTGTPVQRGSLVRLFNFRDNPRCTNPVQTPGQPCGDVFSPAIWSSDHTTLAAGDNGGRIWLWDTAGCTTAPTDLTALVPSGSPAGGVIGGAIDALAFSPINDTLLAAGDRHGAVRLWNLATGKATEIHPFAAGVDIMALAFDPGGTTLAIGGSDGAVEVWSIDPQTGSALKRIASPVAAMVVSPGHLPIGVTRLAFSPSGRSLAIGLSNGLLTVWNVDSGQAVSGHTPQNIVTGLVDVTPIVGLAFSADGRRLLVVRQSGTLQAWDSMDSAPFAIEPVTRAFPPNLDNVAFSPDGRTMALGSLDGVSLWDYQTGARLGLALSGHIGTVPGLSFTTESGLTTLESSDATGQVFVWTTDLASWEHVLQPFQPVAGQAGAPQPCTAR